MGAWAGVLKAKRKSPLPGATHGGRLPLGENTHSLMKDQPESDNAVRLEVVPAADAPPGTMAVATRPATRDQPLGLFGSNDPSLIIAKATSIATSLKDVVRRQGLITKIRDKEYPKCEAWTLLGTLLGVFPVMEWTREIPGGWEARVCAQMKDGTVIGAAEAQCTHKEKMWADRDDYAVRSMAQTRATAKCLRMPLGFVMTLAGYEATPAEEMPQESPPQAQHDRDQRDLPLSRPASPKPTPAKPAAPSFPTEATLKFFVEQAEKKLKDFVEKPREAINRYAEAIGKLLPNEDIMSLPLHWVPNTGDQIRAFVENVKDFAHPGNTPKLWPFDAHQEPSAKGKPIQVPRDENTDPNSPTAPWRSFPIPFGKEAGRKLAQVDKKYLYGLWANFKAKETWTGNDGRVRKTEPAKLAKDRKFRAMLDEAGLHYGWLHKPENDPDDDTPF